MRVGERNEPWNRSPVARKSPKLGTCAIQSTSLKPRQTADLSAPLRLGVGGETARAIATGVQLLLLSADLSALGQDCCHTSLGSIAEGRLWRGQWPDLQDPRCLPDPGIALHYRKPAARCLRNQRGLSSQDFLLRWVTIPTKRNVSPIWGNHHPSAFAGALNFG